MRMAAILAVLWNSDLIGLFTVAWLGQFYDVIQMNDNSGSLIHSQQSYLCILSDTLSPF